MATSRTVPKVFSFYEVFHVGALTQKLRKPKRRSSSYEGPGLSVSLTPVAWEQIARLGGQNLWVVFRRDEQQQGHFVDLTGKKVHQFAPRAVALGLVVAAPVFRVWTTNEDGEREFFEFTSEAEAEAEAEANVDDNNEIEVVQGFRPTAKLQKLWARDFSSKTIPDVLTVAVLYALDMESEYDGAWWDERLDVERLSAPRGVIFPSKLHEWEARKVDWSEAPDAVDTWT